MGLEKNVTGQKWRVFAFNRTTNVPVTGDAANITAKIDKNWAGALATNDVNPTEVEDGYYLFDLLTAETNAKVLDLFPESSTADVQVVGVPGTVYTVTPNFSDLGVEADGDLTKVNTLDLHTAQTGDSFTRLGAPAGASIAADLVEIEAETDDIGVAGAGLTAIPIVPANVTQLNGVAQSLLDLKDFADDGYDPTTDKITGCLLTDVVTALSGHTVQTGDSFARLGAPAGASVSADLVVIETDTDAIKLETDKLTLGDAGAGVTGSLIEEIENRSTFDVTVDLVQLANDAITSAKIDATAANEIADALLDRVSGIETSTTPREALRLILSAVVAKLSGALTTTVLIRDLPDTKNRITATVDGSGNRTAITTDAT